MVPIFTAFIAIALPVYIMNQAARKPLRRPWLYSLGSMTAVMAALCQQLFTVWRRAANSDVSGILDTAGAVLIISVTLALVTLVLNVLAMLICERNE